MRVLYLIAACLLLPGIVYPAAPTLSDFGRPVEIEHRQTAYAYELFPVTLQFSPGKIHLLYMVNRQADPQLLYRNSSDAGATWSEPKELARSSMARAAREGDLLHVAAVTGDTAGFSRYGDSLEFLTVDLKSGSVVSHATLVDGKQAALSLGMPGIAADGNRIMATVIQSPRPEQPEELRSVLLVTSDDRGKTWSTQKFSSPLLSAHPSIAAWPYFRPGGSTGIVVGLDGLQSLEATPWADREPSALRFPQPVDKSAIPFFLSSTPGKIGMLLAAAGEDPARPALHYASSADGVHWSAPTVLDKSLPLDLPTPFVSLELADKLVLAGFTRILGEWQMGQSAARVLISRDQGATFDTLDLSRIFNGGTVLPTVALDRVSGKIAWVTVALLPAEARPRDDVGFAPLNAPAFDAYLLFASSPAAAPGDRPLDQALQTRILSLIDQLGHPDFNQREAATRALTAIGRPAADMLEQALDNPDLEIATRARLILASLSPPWLKPLERVTVP